MIYSVHIEHIGSIRQPSYSLEDHRLGMLLRDNTHICASASTRREEA